MNSVVKHVVATTVVLVASAVLAAFLFVGWGRYDFGADEPHASLTVSLIERARDRSIGLRAARIPVPDLSDARQALRGAGNYEAMCAGCHLSPGAKDSELSRGLYPAPPELSRRRVASAEAFWIIKHGVKASGMPAWGKSMGDEDIWNLVAFLQQLPELDAAKYREIVSRSGGHHHEHAGRAHDDEPEQHDSGHAHTAHAHVESPAPSTASDDTDGTGVAGATKAVTHTHADGTRHVHAPLGNR